MFVRSCFTKTLLALAVVLIGVAVGCQKPADPDTKAAATAKTKEVTVEITGMT